MLATCHRGRSAYLDAAELLAGYLDKAGMPTQVSAVGREHLEAFLAAKLKRVSPMSVHIWYRALQQFFRWAVTTAGSPSPPWRGLHPPVVAEQPVPVIPPEQLAALLKACTGTRFEDRRDLAIIRLFIDTGVRRQELTDLAVGDVDLRLRQATVTGKGRRTRTVAFGHKCAQALDRYIRAGRSTGPRISTRCGSGSRDHSAIAAWHRSSESTRGRRGR